MYRVAHKKNNGYTLYLFFSQHTGSRNHQNNASLLRQSEILSCGGVRLCKDIVSESKGHSTRLIRPRPGEGAVDMQRITRS